MTDEDAPLRQAADTIGPPELAAIRVREQDGILVIVISGEIDISNVERLADVIHAQPNAEDGLVVDLSEVSYLDSSAVSLLHDLAHRLRQRTQPMVVVSTSGSVPRRVLELTAFETNAPLTEDLEAAVRLLAGGSARP